MTTTISSRHVFAAPIIGAFFTASLVSAQIRGNVSPGVRMRLNDPFPEVVYADAPIRTEARPRRGSAVVSAVVSVDVLRNPLAEKPRRMLQKARDAMNAGDHEAAIELLLKALAKFPDAAPYAHRLLGVEYLRTNRFTAAVSSLEQAAQAFPHDAVTRSNFGLSLVCSGDLAGGEREVRRALELDPKNPTMHALFSLLLQSHHYGIEAARSQAPE